MARYGKTIKFIDNLLDKAFYSEGCIVEEVHNRKGEEVYKVQLSWHTSKGSLLRFYHYGTLTLEYNMSKNIINNYYGYSSSDRDSLNTVLDYLGHNSKEYFKLTGRKIILETKKVA